MQPKSQKHQHTYKISHTSNVFQMNDGQSEAPKGFNEWVVMLTKIEKNDDNNNIENTKLRNCNEDAAEVKYCC